MVAEMLQNSKFLLFHLYACYMKSYFDYILYIYVTCFIIYLLYIYMYIILFLIFSHISIFILFNLNLCDNAFIFIICTKLLSCKILII